MSVDYIPVFTKAGLRKVIYDFISKSTGHWRLIYSNFVSICLK